MGRRNHDGCLSVDNRLYYAFSALSVFSVSADSSVDSALGAYFSGIGPSVTFALSRSQSRILLERTSSARVFQPPDWISCSRTAEGSTRYMPAYSTISASTSSDVMVMPCSLATV